jgi:hypothetical protein
MGECIVCKAESTWNWFCPKHTKIKEAAYAEARDLGLTNYYEIIELRDRRLNEDREP